MLGRVMEGHTYKNPWHRPANSEYGPEFYTNVGPFTRYKGFEIHHRLGQVWDVVLDGECKTQRAGFDGAKRWIDQQ